MRHGDLFATGKMYDATRAVYPVEYGPKIARYFDLTTGTRVYL